MARTSTYLNFKRETFAAFDFYRSVFGGEFVGQTMRMRDLNDPKTLPEDLDLIVHIQLEILGGHVLHGTDAPDSMGFDLRQGGNVHLNLEPDTLAEARRLFDALSAGGQVGMPLQPMFWGGTFGSFTDRFGLRWMVNCAAS